MEIPSCVDYINKYIPRDRQENLKRVLDEDDETERDSREISSKSMSDWQVKLASPLGLPQTEIDDILAIHPTNPKLQRSIEALTILAV